MSSSSIFFVTVRGCLALSLLLLGAAWSGWPVAADVAGQESEPSTARWVSISDGVLRQLEAEGKKTDWPGETAGVACDPSTGDVYMIVAGQGVWKSSDHGASFARVDGGKVGGRCETAFSLNFDPMGRRLACLMLDGPGAWTDDGGLTWHGFTDVGRNWDYAAIDWSVPVDQAIQVIFAALHESGGKVMLSGDGGATWKLAFEDPEFDRSGGLGVLDQRTLVYTQKGKGIQRSTDGGRTWTQVSERVPIGRLVRVLGDRAYWLDRDGLLVSTDKGQSWEVQGKPVKASIGPIMDPRDPRRVVVAGIEGIWRTSDGGETWARVATLPPGADIPKAGWYSNVAWDPVGDIFYVSKMGRPTWRLEPNP